GRLGRPSGVHRQSQGVRRPSPFAGPGSGGRARRAAWLTRRARPGDGGAAHPARLRRGRPRVLQVEVRRRMGAALPGGGPSLAAPGRGDRPAAAPSRRVVVGGRSVPGGWNGAPTRGSRTAGGRLNPVL